MHLEQKNDLDNGEAFNYGPSENQTFNVSEVVNAMSEFLPEFSWKEEPLNADGLYESKLLSLNIDKANKVLDWSPRLTFNDIFLLTADWYKNFYSLEETNMLEITNNQIKDYIDRL